MALRLRSPLPHLPPTPRLHHRWTSATPPSETVPAWTPGSWSPLILAQNLFREFAVILGTAPGSWPRAWHTVLFSWEERRPGGMRLFHAKQTGRLADSQERPTLKVPSTYRSRSEAVGQTLLRAGQGYVDYHRKTTTSLCCGTKEVSDPLHSLRIF